MEYILETRNLTKDFQGFFAVSDVSIQFEKNKTHAIIGPNGAGKSTLFNLITGCLHPASGGIYFKERDITKLLAADIPRIGMARSFQISAVFLHMTVLQNVQVAIQRRRGLTYQFWRPIRILKAIEDEAMSYLEQVGLAEVANAQVAELPYGRKRALEIATTLAADPEVLLLDEPMAGLGIDSIKSVSALIRRLGKGRTVIMVEHNMNVVADLSDRITVLQHGRVLAEGSYDIVSKDPRVIDAYIGAGNYEDVLQDD